MKKFIRKAVTLASCAALMILGASLTAYAADDDETAYVYGTSINGVSVAGMTTDEAKTAIEDYYRSSYTLKIKDGYGTENEISAPQIAYSMTVTGDLDAVLENQNKSGRKQGPGESNSQWVEYSVSYSDELLAGVIADLTLVTEASPTTDAHLSAYAEGEDFTIIKEVKGTQLDIPKFTAAVKSSLDNQSLTMDLASSDCYKQITVYSTSPELTELCDIMNTFNGMTITYVIGDETETLDTMEIASWVTGSDGTELSVDRSKAAAYVAALAQKYDTYGQGHPFHTSTGEDIIVYGSYGWKINQDAETDALIQLIKNRETAVREPIYVSTAASHDTYDFGDTYVEVDLTGQHLYYYEDGVCILDCPVVTGDVARDMATPAGLYTVDYKQKDRVLRGQLQADGTYEYETPVSYWMPFNGGIGFHDASWRSSFGGTIYLTNGSHGCVNMPPAKAAELYDHIYAGMPVICHE